MNLMPDDICLEIFAQFKCHPLKNQCTVNLTLPKTLVSISRTCKRFYRLVKPLIYRTIAIEASDGKHERFVQFARALVSNSQLGHDIHEIVLKGGDHHGTYDDDDALKKKWLSLDAPVSFKKRSWQELGNGSTIGLAPLILALTPRVQLVDYTHSEEGQSIFWILSGRLDLEVPTSEDFYRTFTTDEMEAMEAHALVRDNRAHRGYANYGLPDLEEAHISTEDPTEGNTPIHVLEPVLLHPTLRTLHLYGVSLLDHSIGNFKFPHEPCNLENLDLQECLFDHSSLEIILTRCKKLKRLSMESAGQRRHRFWKDGSWDLDLPEFGNVLKKVGQNLEFFNLNCDHSDEPHVALGYIGTTLRDLNGLSHLKIRLSDLVETERKQIAPLAGALPPTIETLHLYWDSIAHKHSNYKRFCDKTRRAVFTLLMAVDQVPNLRSVSIDRHGAEGEDEKLEWEKCVEGWRGKATQESFNFERQPDTMNQ